MRNKLVELCGISSRCDLEETSGVHKSLPPPVATEGSRAIRQYQLGTPPNICGVPPIISEVLGQTSAGVPKILAGYPTDNGSRQPANVWPATPLIIGGPR